MRNAVNPASSIVHSVKDWVKLNVHLVLEAAKKSAFIAAAQASRDALVAVATEKMSVFGAMEVAKNVALPVVEREKMMMVIPAIGVMVPGKKIVLLAVGVDTRDAMTVLGWVMRNAMIAMGKVLKIVVFVPAMGKFNVHNVLVQQKSNVISVKGRVITSMNDLLYVTLNLKIWLWERQPYLLRSHRYLFCFQSYN